MNAIPRTILPIDSGDVKIQKLPRRYCTECVSATATHEVVIDIRNAGQGAIVGECLCLMCARRMAQRIAEALPRRGPE